MISQQGIHKYITLTGCFSRGNLFLIQQWTIGTKRAQTASPLSVLETLLELRAKSRAERAEHLAVCARGACAPFTRGYCVHVRHDEQCIYVTVFNTDKE